ncbi:MAG: ferrous iron transport protein A [Oscillatoriales cyanobacterium SM2_2_1]|nr:ferrous iron transport protein A [Oscillatoriales cyanobacterium SM2_2_1]
MFYTISSASLSLLRPGERGEVLPSRTTDGVIHSQLIQLGVIPGKPLVVLGHHPEPIVRMEGKVLTIPAHLSHHVRVRILDSRIRYPPQSTASMTSDALMTA